MATWCSRPLFMRMCTCEWAAETEKALPCFRFQLDGDGVSGGQPEGLEAALCAAKPAASGPAHRDIDGEHLQEGLIQGGLGGRHLVCRRAAANMSRGTHSTQRLVRRSLHCAGDPCSAAPSRLTDRSARAASTRRCAEVRPATRRCSLSSQAAWDTSLPFEQGAAQMVRE